MYVETLKRRKCFSFLTFNLTFLCKISLFSDYSVTPNCFSKGQTYLITSVLQRFMDMWACGSAFSKGFASQLHIFSLIYCFAHHGSADRNKNMKAHQGETNVSLNVEGKERLGTPVTPPQGKYWSWAAIMFNTFILFVTAINKPILLKKINASCFLFPSNLQLLLC